MPAVDDDRRRDESGIELDFNRIGLNRMSTNRRQVIQATAFISTATALSSTLPTWARSGHSNAMHGISSLNGDEFDLHVDRATANVNGRRGDAIVVNGQLPAPLLRWKEGDELRLRVTNHLDESTSIHWHGILVPPSMDGVPGLSFPGIPPHSTFTYEFPVKQAGTYWYHSHSGLQEQQGHYGPLIIDPKGEDPVAFDREYVLVLSDWTFENPHDLFAKLKKKSNVYNRSRRTLLDWLRDVRSDGFRNTVEERGMWHSMRMDPTDLADVTGSTYSFLINGHGVEDNWTALYRPGERVRLRFINASAMTIFDVRIPGLPMQVVQADGLDVRPIETDEFQIGVAETFDVVVQPSESRTYAVIAEGSDRSGLVRATLATEEGARATIPNLRERTELSMRDMAMDHSGHAGHAHHGHHSSSTNESQEHPLTRGPGVAALAEQPTNRLHERPLSLQDESHRVLVYSDLKSFEPNPDTRAPEREIELHLTGNMERFMWSFDGVRFSNASEPIVLNHRERIRLVMVNNTMMPHPIHLHGMFFDVVNGADKHKPRKHTIVVKGGERMAVDVTADALGDWAFHCHLLYHMHAGMMRVVSVRA